MGKLNDLRKRVKHLEKQLDEVARVLGLAGEGKGAKKGTKKKAASRKRKVVRTATGGSSAMRGKSEGKGAEGNEG